MWCAAIWRSHRLTYHKWASATVPNRYWTTGREHQARNEEGYERTGRIRRGYWWRTAYRDSNTTASSGDIFGLITPETPQLQVEATPGWLCVMKSHEKRRELMNRHNIATHITEILQFEPIALGYLSEVLDTTQRKWERMWRQHANIWEIWITINGYSIYTHDRPWEFNISMYQVKQGITLETC